MIGVNMYYKKIKGKKVYLSPADIDNEAVILTKWFNEDEDIASNNGFERGLLGIEKVREKLEKWNEGPYLFSIINNDNDEFMGHVTLFNVSQYQATMGIYIGDKYRHHGYGREAIEMLMNYAFNTINLKAIHLEVFGYNEHAKAVYESLGFKECGRWHDVLYHDGRFHDIILMEYVR